jgi:signal transduction histidine kinase/CHASE3 domain sensor protein
MTFLASVGLRAKLLGAFGAVLVILVTLASAAYRTTVLNQDALDAVVHTLEVIGAANGAFADLVDMETSYRGFLLTGDDMFLQPYVDADREIDDELAHVESLTTDNQAQVERWRSIQEQVTQWRHVATEPGIALRRAVTAGTATQDDLTRFVAAGEGRRRFTMIRSTFDQALTVESSLLAERQADANNRRIQLEVVLPAGTLLAVALGIGLALLLGADLIGPVTRLATTAREIAGGHLDRRIGLRRTDEIGVAAAAFDQMADQLQTTIVRGEAILTTAAEGILGLDRDGSIIFANPAAARMLGMAPSTLIGQNPAAWLLPEPGPISPAAPEDHDGADVSSPDVNEAAGPAGTGSGRVLSPDIAQEGAGDLVRPGDGSRVPIEYASAPILDSDQSGDGVTGAVLTFRDVTERRAVQRALEERARELARSNADLEQFAYVASHDLQEPLRAVVSYLQLLERRYGGKLDERAEKYIGYAVDGGRRMQTLITDLLTYSRVGRREVEMEPVDLDVILDRVLSGLRVAIEESDAVVTHEPLPTIVADTSQMTQLFQNLIGNAVKFRGEEAPRIEISAERQEAASPASVAPGTSNGAWLFAVRDNGIGIAPEYRERVFVLFQRLHGRDEYSGTGIGLAVCKRIVERRGGTLWVDDAPGGGSTFRFTIPDPGDDSA